MELNQTLPNSRRYIMYMALTDCRKHFGVPSPKTSEPKKLSNVGYFLSRDVMANMFINKHAVDIQETALETVKGLRYQDFVNFGPQTVENSTEVFTTLFRVCNLMAYNFVLEHAIANQKTALETTKNLLHCFKISRTLVYKRRRIGPESVSTLRFFNDFET